VSGRDTAERRYRRLLRAYPAGYREAHGEEILGTLLEASGDRPWPSAREAAGLVGGGLTARVRARAAAPIAWWADGLHLGVCALTALNAAIAMAAQAGYGWYVGVAALTLLTLRGRVRVAFVLALVGTVQVGWWRLSGSGDGLPLGPTYSDWGAIASCLGATAGLLVLALRRPGGLRSRSWWWVAPPVIALAGVMGVQAYPYHWLWLAVQTTVEGVLLLAGIWATANTGDPRWVLAAAVYLLPWVAVTATDVPRYAGGSLLIDCWGVLTVLLLGMAGTAWRVRRARA
jgi:hypothetical protein